MNKTIFEIIDNDIKNNDVVLYMKGTSDTPMCGFSVTVVHILKKLGIEFKDINVLADNEIREGIKQFSKWPTIPQLYIKGEFIGGCDIVKELYETGELLELFKTNKISTTV
ncbi:Monothiol glutaredoxin [Rickettsiales bacterium Ac37b]|nr:Monothiol glutaredoxin [Rickettsiales bacterium Ac37b]